MEEGVEEEKRKNEVLAGSEFEVCHSLWIRIGGIPVKGAWMWKNDDGDGSKWWWKVVMYIEFLVLSNAEFKSNTNFEFRSELTYKQAIPN